jgi:DNA-binding transcriptional regulator WhiA
MGKLSEVQKQELVSKYLNGESFLQLGKYFNINQKSAWSIVNTRNKLNRTKEQACTKHTLDVDYFKTIDTDNKAYILGLFLADGSISTKGRAFKISLKKSDEYILYKIKEELNYGGKLYIIKNKVRFLNDKLISGEDQTSLHIVRKHFSDNIINLGVCLDKTKNLILPTDKIPIELYSHFVRGFFDGDGCAYIAKNSGTVCINISCLYNVATQLKEMLKIYNIEVKISKKLLGNKEEINLVCLKISKCSEVRKFCDFIYKDAELFLERKYKKISSGRIYTISELKKKYNGNTL